MLGCRRGGPLRWVGWMCGGAGEVNCSPISWHPKSSAPLSYCPKGTSGSTVATQDKMEPDKQPTSSSCTLRQRKLHRAPPRLTRNTQSIGDYRRPPATVSMMPCRVPAAAAISSSFLLTTKLWAPRLSRASAFLLGLVEMTVTCGQKSRKTPGGWRQAKGQGSGRVGLGGC